MSGNDPEMLWAFLLVDGVTRLSEAERADLALWFIGQSSAERGALCPATPSEAGHVRGLAQALTGANLAELAVPLARLALAAAETLSGPQGRLALDALATLGAGLLHSVAADECLPVDEAARLTERYLGADVQDIMVPSQEDLDEAARLIGWADDNPTHVAALSMARLGLARLEHFHGRESEALARALRVLAAILLAGRSWDEAGQVLTRLECLFAAHRDDTAADVASGWSAVIAYYRAYLLEHLGQTDEAAALLDKALADAEAALGAGGDWTDIIRKAKVAGLLSQGRQDDAVTLLRAASSRLDAEIGEQSPAPVGLSSMAADVALELGDLLLQMGKPREAREPLARGLDIVAGIGEDWLRMGQASYLLAVANWRSEDDGDVAVPGLFRAAFAAYSVALGPSDEATLYTREALGVFLWQRRRWEEAEAELAPNHADSVRHHGEGSEIATNLHRELSRFHRHWLWVREDGLLYAWALSNNRMNYPEDRFGLAVAMLRDVARQADRALDADSRDAEAATLLAAAGRTREALAIAETCFEAPEGCWAPARIYAAAAAVCDGAQRHDVLVQAVKYALVTAIPDGGKDRALLDLAEALDRVGGTVMDQLLRMLDDDSRASVREAAIAARCDEDDLDGGLEDAGPQASAMALANDFDDNANARDAIAHSRKLAGWGRFEDAVSALASLRNPFAVISECIGIAEASTDPQATAQALRAAFHRLPGPIPAGTIIAGRLELDYARKLGEAAARLLPEDEQSAFAEAALTKAARLQDLRGATALVVAAGYASLVQRV